MEEQANPRQPDQQSQSQSPGKGETPGQQQDDRNQQQFPGKKEEGEQPGADAPAQPDKQ